MAAPSKNALQQKLLDELEEISKMISENTDAADEALKAFRKKHLPASQRSITAKADLLTLIIASVRNTFDKQGIDDAKLFTWFFSDKKYEEAGQLLLAKARHFFMNGNLIEGEKVLIQVRKQLLDKISARAEIVYFTRMAFLHGRKHEYDAQLNVCLQALAKLREMNDATPWNYNIATIFYTNIANCYINSSDFDKAWDYLQQSLEVAERPDVSTYNKFNVYSYFAFYFDARKEHRKSAEWHDKIIALLKGDAIHQTYLVQSYLMAIVQYHLYYRDNTLTKKEQQLTVARQEKYQHEVSKLIKPDLKNGSYLTFLYATATLLHQKKEYKKAADTLNRCMPVYIKMNHGVSILNCYRLSHEIYSAWGRQTNDARMLYKAYELKQKESRIVEETSQQSQRQKLEAVQVKHNLQQAELNAQLLQQKVDAMNKEVQLAALNLQEKVALLDELKSYVLSLKKKEYGQKPLIQDIAQKIGAVKITEQDKAVLQQKIDVGNAALFKKLSERYPELTTHEVRTCGLLKTGMTNKELSRLYGQGERGYEQLRYRIKKKMNLARQHDLVKHLVSLSNVDVA